MKVKELILSTRFIRNFKKLPPTIRREALEREKLFKENPFDSKLKTHKFHGKFSYFWSFSITQKHRVMFEFRENGIIAFIDIGDHSIYS